MFLFYNVFQEKMFTTKIEDVYYLDGDIASLQYKTFTSEISLSKLFLLCFFFLRFDQRYINLV